MQLFADDGVHLSEDGYFKYVDSVRVALGKAIPSVVQPAAVTVPSQHPDFEMVELNMPMSMSDL